jgi:hypothetical protein
LLSMWSSTAGRGAGIFGLFNRPCKKLDMSRTRVNDVPYPFYSADEVRIFPAEDTTTI